MLARTLAGKECHGTCAPASICLKRQRKWSSSSGRRRSGCSPTQRPRPGGAIIFAFGCPPSCGVALAARVKGAGQEFAGEQRELYLIDEQPGEEAPYERLLGDPMVGNGALLAREDAVEAAWAVVDRVLKSHHRAIHYRRGSWGLKEADALIAADGTWHNPILGRAKA